MLVKELASRKNRVDCVRVGYVITESTITSGMAGVASETTIARTPLGRALHPGDIAASFALLASAAASIVSDDAVIVVYALLGSLELIFDPLDLVG